MVPVFIYFFYRQAKNAPDRANGCSMLTAVGAYDGPSVPFPSDQGE
jgi:hypothetical protein